MKKILLVILSFLITGSISLFSEKNHSDLSLSEQNIEALTDNEDISGMIECYGSGGIYCPLNQKSIYKGVIMYQ